MRAIILPLILLPLAALADPASDAAMWAEIEPVALKANAQLQAIRAYCQLPICNGAMLQASLQTQRAQQLAQCAEPPTTPESTALCIRFVNSMFQ